MWTAQRLTPPTGDPPPNSTLSGTCRMPAGWLLAEGHKREGGEWGEAELLRLIMSVMFARIKNGDSG